MFFGLFGPEWSLLAPAPSNRSLFITEKGNRKPNLPRCERTRYGSIIQLPIYVQHLSVRSIRHVTKTQMTVDERRLMLFNDRGSSVRRGRDDKISLYDCWSQTWSAENRHSLLCKWSVGYGHWCGRTPGFLLSARLTNDVTVKSKVVYLYCSRVPVSAGFDLVLREAFS